MTRKIFLRLCLLFFVQSCLSSAAFAQTTASIKGTVTDESGAVIAGAKVVVKNTALGIERAVASNSEGYYEVPALPPGSYSVEVQMQGFQHSIANGVILDVSQNAVQNFGLRISTSDAIVIVEGTQAVIESTTMSVGQVINQNVVQEIPLNGRHFVDLALLVPGTVTPPSNGFLTAPLRGQGSFAFNSAGGREDAINFMINGINLNDMVQNQVTFQPTINTVSEFKIDNSTYSAEYGRNSGSIVNIATRSGTEQFHGEAYDYLRNNWFDARNFFNPQFTSNGAANPQSVLKRNQFGGDFGGPIKHGKTYLFLSYEGLRHRQGLTTTSLALTDAERTQIQNSGSPSAQGLLTLIPASNGVIGTSPAFFGSATAPVNLDQGTADISHNIGNSDRIHGYYANQKDLRQEPTQGADIPGFGDTRQGHRQVFTFGETHVFSSALVNEARLGVNRIHILFSPNNPTSPASVNLGGALGPNMQFVPVIRIQDKGLIFGAERNFPQGRGDLTSVLGDTLNYVRGRHSFKFGGEFRDFRNNNFNNDPGQLTFNNTTNFINGNVDSAARTIGNVASRIAANALDFFAQDSYKVLPSVTLELGLRYAWNMTPGEAMNRFVVFDPATDSLVRVGAGLDKIYNQNSRNFQPRVGFAWDTFHNGKTIVRGGYGYQVDQPITGLITALASNPPFAFPISANFPATAPAPVSTLGPLFSGTPSSITPLTVNHDFRNANVQSWNLNVQHQITKDTGIMVGYFGVKGTHLEIDRNLNQPTVPGNSDTRPFIRVLQGSILPLTGLGPIITQRDSSSNSIYHALWVTANRRFSHGLQFNASYTFSHSIDDNSRNAETVVMQDSTNVPGERGSSDFDVRHRFVANAIYELPFKGNRLVAGWEVASIVTTQTGNPFNVVLATATLNGVGNTVRPNIFAPLVVTGDPAHWFDLSSAAAAFPVADNAQTGFGNLGRNAFTGSGFTDVDFAVVKNTKVTERFNLQFRVDAFDVLNHPNFAQPGPFTGFTSSSLIYVTNPANPAGPKIISSSFGAITATRFPTADAGSSRQLQLALKLRF
jgi:Carboxypeptidase regulatory-like domain